MSKNILKGFIGIVAFFASCQAPQPDAARCGDGHLDPGEECDQDIGAHTCNEPGYYHPQGTVACTSDCRLDFSDCGGRCGNGLLEPEHGELCDGLNLNGRDCQSLGFSGGTLSCSSDCRSFEEGACVRLCGDGRVDPGEACDDANQRTGDGCSTTCQVEAGWTCDETNPSTCQTVCSDGVAAGDEACDQLDVRGRNCVGLGYYVGVLECTGSCELDLSSCEQAGWCGDGILQEDFGETCEPALEMDNPCLAQGYYFGNPTCSVDCELQHATCGNTFLWGTVDGDDGFAIALDPAGGVYVAGVTWGDFGVGGTAGAIDMFLTKFGPDLRLQWTRQFGSAGWDTATGVAVDSHGDVYVSGIVNGSFDGQDPVGDNDVSLIKFNAEGTKLWSRQFGTGRHDQSDGLVLDSSGDVLIVGAMQYLPPGQTDLGQYDALLLKVDASGSLLWMRHWGSVNNDVANAVALDPDGDILVTGVTEGPMGEEPTFGYDDIFLTKLDADGEVLWTRTMGTASWDYGYGVKADDHGNIYITGHVSRAIDGQVSHGLSDGFLTKWTPTGEKLWTRLFGSGGDDQGTDLALNAAGEIHVVGWVTGSMDGHQTHGGQDGFLVVFDDQGQQLTSVQWGTGYEDSATCIALDAAGLVYVSGSSPGPLEGQVSSGSWDAYLKIQGM